jgi:hypothetical protein
LALGGLQNREHALVLLASCTFKLLIAGLCRFLCTSRV